MNVVIFNDKDNLDGSLKLLNKGYALGEKRFWDYKKYIPFFFEKLKELEGFKDKDLKLVKTFFYTGKYNSRLVNKIKIDCQNKIKEIEEMITKERNLLEEVNKNISDINLLNKIREHVSMVISVFQGKKEQLKNHAEKQKRNFYGQKALFKDLDNNPLIDLKTTPLKQADGIVYQKGVDGKIVTDLVNLAHTKSYDIAFILGGDTDLIEAIKLIKDNLSKIVVVASCFNNKDPSKSNISDVKEKCDYFMNIYDYSQELFDISERLKIKEFEKE